MFVASVAAVLLAFALLPFAVHRASATLCPSGYEPGPDTFIENGGVVTKIPGPCVPIEHVDIVQVDPAVLGGITASVTGNDEIDLSDVDPEVLDSINDAVLDDGEIDLSEVDPEAIDSINDAIIEGEIDISDVDPDVIDAINDAVLGDDCDLPPCGSGDGGTDPVGQPSGDETPGDGGTSPNDQPPGNGNDGTPPVLGPAGVPADGGVILVAKHACPVGFQAYVARYADLAAACTDDMGSAGFGLRQIESVEQVLFSEEVPAGYGNPVVFCGLTARGGEDQVAKFTKSEVTEGAVSVDLSAGDRVRCDWFNVPVA